MLRAGTRRDPLQRIGCVLLAAAFLCAGGAAARAAAAEDDPVAFGTLPALWNVRLSPDGSKLSFLQMHPEDLPILRVHDVRGGEASIALASVRDEFDIEWCEWANAERLLCGFSGVVRSGWRRYATTRLVAVNADGSDMKVLLQRRLRDRFAQFQDQIVDWLVDDPQHVLVGMPDDEGMGVSRLDIYEGKVGHVEGARSKARYWISDNRGEPRLYLYDDGKKIVWYGRKAGEERWRSLHEATPEELRDDYHPVGFAEDPDTLLVLKPSEGRLALWAEPLDGEGGSRLVFAHPEVDVDGALTLGKFRRMVAVAYATDTEHLHFFDPAVSRIVEQVGGVIPGATVGVVDESWDRELYLVHVQSEDDPGSFHLYEPGPARLRRLASQYPLLKGRRLGAMQPIRYRARDETEIPAYLTLPPGGPEQPLPAVILPHGGPEARDVRGFDFLVQFLAARGFAVLQSNYRGSGGYGEGWAGAGGFRAWRLAVDDLTDGARYLVASGIAEPRRICIVGWSYGGYAALMSAIEEPDLYRCAVGIAGVSDPKQLIEDHRDFLSWRAVKEFVGTDDEVLEAGSPLRRAAEIRAPILLFHGEEDLNVSVEHSRKLARALERARKPVDYVEYEEVEHQIFRNAHRIDLLRRIGAFLDSHIGSAAASAAAE